MATYYSSGILSAVSKIVCIESNYNCHTTSKEQKNGQFGLAAFKFIEYQLCTSDYIIYIFILYTTLNYKFERAVVSCFTDVETEGETDQVT